MKPGLDTAFALRLHPDDNVLIAARDLAVGTRIPGTPPMELRQRIALGHKFAATRIATGQTIVKYGHAIAIAAQTIAAG